MDSSDKSWVPPDMTAIQRVTSPRHHLPALDRPHLLLQIAEKSAPWLLWSATVPIKAGSTAQMNSTMIETWTY